MEDLVEECLTAALLSLLWMIAGENMIYLRLDEALTDDLGQASMLSPLSFRLFSLLSIFDLDILELLTPFDDYPALS